MRLFRMLNVVNVQCHGYYGDFPMNVFNIVIALIVQRRRFGANILMSVFAIMNVFNPQHRVCYDDYSMNVFNIATALVCNAVGLVPIFPWMYLPLRMSQRCNAVEFILISP